MRDTVNTTSLDKMLARPSTYMSALPSFSNGPCNSTVDVYSGFSFGHVVAAIRAHTSDFVYCIARSFFACQTITQFIVFVDIQPNRCAKISTSPSRDSQVHNHFRILGSAASTIASACRVYANVRVCLCPFAVQLKFYRLRPRRKVFCAENETSVKSSDNCQNWSTVGQTVILLLCASEECWHPESIEPPPKASPFLAESSFRARLDLSVCNINASQRNGRRHKRQSKTIQSKCASAICLPIFPYDTYTTHHRRSKQSLCYTSMRQTKTFVLINLLHYWQIALTFRADIIAAAFNLQRSHLGAAMNAMRRQRNCKIEMQRTRDRKCIHI